MPLLERPVRVFRWVLASTLLAAAPLSASNFSDYSNVCSSGAFAACASVQVVTTVLSNGGTLLEIRVRNLEGTHPYATVGTQIINFMAFGSNVTQLRDPGTYPSTDPTQHAIGSVAGSPNQLEEAWELDPFHELQFFPSIAGCSLPAGGLDPSVGGWQTCDAQGLTGWVAFRFTLTRLVQASDVYVDLGVNGAVQCRVGSTTAGVPGCAFQDPGTTVPEPTTVVLVGSGLLAVAALRRRRAPPMSQSSNLQ